MGMRQSKRGWAQLEWQDWLARAEVDARVVEPANLYAPLALQQVATIFIPDDIFGREYHEYRIDCIHAVIVLSDQHRFALSTECTAVARDYYNDIMMPYRVAKIAGEILWRSAHPRKEWMRPNIFSADGKQCLGRWERESAHKTGQDVMKGAELAGLTTVKDYGYQFERLWVGYRATQVSAQDQGSVNFHLSNLTATPAQVRWIDIRDGSRPSFDFERWTVIDQITPAPGDVSHPGDRRIASQAMLAATAREPARRDIRRGVDWVVCASQDIGQARYLWLQCERSGTPLYAEHASRWRMLPAIMEGK